MAFQYAYLLPIIVAIWFPLTFITTYIIAVCNNDVIPVFPYISDTGSWSPESCIFALMLNVGAVFQGLISYIRYRQVRDLCEKNQFKSSLKKLNFIAGILGYFAAFGIGVVGDFQETNVFVVHLLGAGMAFGIGSLYLTIQTYLSFKMYPTFGNKTVNIIRLIFTIICFVSLWVTFIFASLAFLQYSGNDITKWSKEDGGYNNRFVSVISEWILALSTMIYILLFTGEFKLLAISEPIISDRTKP